MNKTIFIVTATLISIIFAVKIGLFNALFMLFLAGVIPGTQIVIPANIMLFMISAVMCYVLLFSTAKDIIRIIFDHHSTKSKKTLRTHLPKRRFSEI